MYLVSSAFICVPFMVFENVVIDYTVSVYSDGKTW